MLSKVLNDRKEPGLGRLENSHNICYFFKERICPYLAVLHKCVDFHCILVVCVSDCIQEGVVGHLFLLGAKLLVQDLNHICGL